MKVSAPVTRVGYGVFQAGRVVPLQAISNLRFDKVSWEADSSRGVSLKQPTQRLPRGRRIISLDEVAGAKTNKVPKPND